MKKIIKMLFVVILIFTVSGCTEIKQEQPSTPSPKSETTTQEKTCTMINSETKLRQEFTFNATDGIIDKVKLKMIYDNDILGVDSFATFTEEQKEQYKSNMLNNIGLDETSFEGLDIIFEFNEQLSVTLEANLDEVEPELLKKVGLNFENVDLDFDKAIQGMEKAGATCK